MTWSLSAAGHHGSSNWEEEERVLLQRLVDAIDGAPDAICSTFSFSGNHIYASSLDDAKSKLAPAEGDVSGEEPVEEG